jgi:hypothetical protein
MFERFTEVVAQGACFFLRQDDDLPSPLWG